VPLETLLPVADGDVMQWVANPVGAGYSAVVDFDVADEDASYLEGQADGQVFTVKAQTGYFTHPVRRVGYVAVFARVRRRVVGGGFGSFAARVHSGAGIFQGPTQVVTTAFVDYDGSVLDGWLCETDPATGQPWTVDAAIQAQVGLVRVAANAGMRCTKIRKLMMVVYGQAGAVRGPDTPRWWR